jgi:hypothetical protein
VSPFGTSPHPEAADHPDELRDSIAAIVDMIAQTDDA